jgi:3D (Asp-Asp-Asp) domain-containing protein
MKRLLIIPSLLCLASTATAKEQVILARGTVYWPMGSGAQLASSNGATLRSGHCAVDPKKISYGSRVIFPDADCIAVDSGPAVISRTAARRSGKTLEQCAALVVDRFFETKKQAIAWAASNPHFMKLRVLDPYHKTADRPASNIRHENGAESAQEKPTKTYSQETNLAPANMRGSLIPLSFGAALPRS